MTKQIQKLTYLSFLLFIISGCHSVPLNNVDFAQIKNIKELEGSYNNYGEGKSNTRFVYLSQLIWQNEEGLQHFSIQSIEVKMANERTLSVRAMGENGVIKEEVFVQGEDFDFSSGLIPLPGHFGFPYPIIGSSYENSGFGLDIRTDGKYKVRTTTAGLLALIIPAAFTETEEFRFKRMKK